MPSPHHLDPSRYWPLRRSGVTIALTIALLILLGFATGSASAEDPGYGHQRSALTTISCPGGFAQSGVTLGRDTTCIATYAAEAIVDASGVTTYVCPPLAASDGAGTCTEIQPFPTSIYPTNPSAPVVPPGYEATSAIVSEPTYHYVCPADYAIEGVGSATTCTYETTPVPADVPPTVEAQPVLWVPAMIGCPSNDYLLRGVGFLALCLRPIPADGSGEPPAPEPLRCGLKLVTINLNDGDSGVGTDADDVILGTPGDDAIFGLGGNDTICAGAGRDRVHGGDGRDVIIGGDDRDRLWGGADRDRIYGDGGSDSMYGGSGNDDLIAGSGADRVFGGDGRDYLAGMGGQDFLYGEAGNDLLQGNWQSDHLHGGDGDDTLRGAGGKDKLFGNAGDDMLFGGLNTDYLDGGDGHDTADGQRGKDNPLLPGTSGCIAEIKTSC